MEAAARQRQRPPQREEEEEEVVAEGSPAPSLSGQSYWLDLWLFIFFDLALFVIIYLLP